MKWYNESNFELRTGTVYVVHYSEKSRKDVITQDKLDKEKRDTTFKYDPTKSFVKEGRWWSPNMSTPFVWAFHFNRINWKNAKAWIYEEDLLQEYYANNEKPVEPADIVEKLNLSDENLNLSEIQVNKLR